MDYPVGFEGVLERLDVVEQRGRWFTARCPAHEDRTPSLSVGVTEDGQALILKCFAGCTNEAVMDAAGIRPRELFRGNGMDVKQRIVKTYSYRDEKGKELYQVVRMEPKAFRQRRKVSGRWEWNLNGVQRVLYRLPELLAKPTAAVVICEGEKDADRLSSIGVLATTNSGGAKKWQDDFAIPLKGRKVAIIPDNDPVGRLHALTVGASLMLHGAATIRFVELPGLQPHGDVSDWLDMGHTRDELIAEINKAREWK